MCRCLQDVVTREGKMLFMYKRPGQRVIVNAAGQMMVRPTHIEASAQKSVGGTHLYMCCHLACLVGVQYCTHLPEWSGFLAIKQFCSQGA